MADAPLVLFDGVCNLCNGTVNYILDHDPRGVFRFAALQSEAARAALARAGLAAPAPGEDPDSIVFVESDGRVYERSAAALRIARRLTGPVKLLWGFIVVPAFVRDFVYRAIARNRYRLFGKSEQCRVPTPELRARFLG